MTLCPTSTGCPPSCQPLDLEDEDEFDITLDYKPVSSRLKGLWIRLRYAEANRGDKDGRDFRAIINYNINVLGVYSFSLVELLYGVLHNESLVTHSE